MNVVQRVELDVGGSVEASAGDAKPIPEAHVVTCRINGLAEPQTGAARGGPCGQCA